jgi:hypothetical protein
VQRSVPPIEANAGVNKESLDSACVPSRYMYSVCMAASVATKLQPISNAAQDDAAQHLRCAKQQQALEARASRH